MTDLVRTLLHPAHRGNAATQPPGDLGVLVVDDEGGIRRFVERVLRAGGYVPVMTPSGSEALRAAAAMPRLDLLIADMMMPQMNGDEVARQLRAQHPDLKVLYLTGYSDRLFAEKALLWEGEAFLDKPCSIAGLTQAVALLVSGHLDATPQAPASEGVSVSP